MYRFNADTLLVFYCTLQQIFIVIVLCISIKKLSYDVTVSVYMCHVLGLVLVGTEVNGRLCCSLEPWHPPEVYIKIILQDDMPDCTVCALNKMKSSFGTF
jgi:hypothetical protein